MKKQFKTFLVIGLIALVYSCNKNDTITPLPAPSPASIPPPSIPVAS